MSKLTPLPDMTGGTDDEKVERMVNWFFQNFEDPAERTPYESAEGGYQWIWGGPYDAREILDEVFNDPGVAIIEGRSVVQQGVKDKLIDAAVAQIEEDNYEWAPVSHPSDYE